MDTNEIVVHREQRDGMGVVLDLLAECVGQPSKAARMHPNAEIGALGLPEPNDESEEPERLKQAMGKDVVDRGLGAPGLPGMSEQVSRVGWHR